MNSEAPHCPSWTGGVAATSIKVAKHRQGADGVVVQMFCSSLNNHPVCADSSCFAIFSLWHSHPSWPGGAMELFPNHSHLHSPRLQLHGTTAPDAANATGSYRQAAPPGFDGIVSWETSAWAYWKHFLNVIFTRRSSGPNPFRGSSAARAVRLSACPTASAGQLVFNT